MSGSLSNVCRSLVAVGWVGMAVAICLFVAPGCDSQPISFSGNALEKVKQEHVSGADLGQAESDIQAIMQAWFGTPDQPIVPVALQDLVQVDRIERSAGPVSSTEDGEHQGLYREHCAVCHGLNGNGRGPASGLQNPYPRDFRMGVYKFKSTPRGTPPTREDLLATLHRGAPGTAMPTFHSLPESDREALVDYVIYLSVRGMLERQLWQIAAEEFDYDSQPLPPEERLYAAGNEGTDDPAFVQQVAAIDELLLEITQAWLNAPQLALEIPEVPADVGRNVGTAEEEDSELVEIHDASVARGKALFHGQTANCVGCHGPAGKADVATLDFDDWTKDWTTRINITPTDTDAIAPFRAAGALRPRPAKPRNLQLGAFHGGSDPGLLYTRIVNGIDGTPMPAMELVEHPQPVGLTQRQVWDLINYVLSLSPADVAPLASESLVLPESSR
ncbi:Cytochrome c [Roseimaritima multifibrata]|uniref:Cytochrome c n=1 Tax=Roseimaritima multifibrata TaxID=1930274 RepID=A0A517MMR0_9BACT|nr:cytochrome c [Roseimaritima multifibrata]QDS96162.1 Cytochrome c [Roseimaritima multifibrata]